MLKEKSINHKDYYLFISFWELSNDTNDLDVHCARLYNIGPSVGSFCSEASVSGDYCDVSHKCN